MTIYHINRGGLFATRHHSSSPVQSGGVSPVRAETNMVQGDAGGCHWRSWQHGVLYRGEPM